MIAVGCVLSDRLTAVPAGGTTRATIPESLSSANTRKSRGKLMKHCRPDPRRTIAPPLTTAISLGFILNLFVEQIVKRLRHRHPEHHHERIADDVLFFSLTVTEQMVF